MPIFTEVRSGERFLEDIESPFLDTLAASADGALTHSPTSSLRRMIELDNAEVGVPSSVSGLEFGIPEYAEPKSPLLTADDARAKVKEAGVKLTVPDTGIRGEALDILIERKRNEMIRTDTLNRGPSGFLPGAARFGTALAASLFDPINVASAFVPVVGQARYAMMLGRAASTAGRVGVRAGVGAVEGLAGSLLTEPIVLAAAGQEQADYDLADSLLNIALGTALGGGLHVGVGAAAEAIARRQHWQQAKATEPLPKILEQADPEIRETALRVGVSQALTGRQIDVGAIIGPSVSYTPRPEQPSIRASVGPREGFTIEPETLRGVAGVRIEGVKAFHGSPHDFDRFSMEKIGTGEGAQAYGHGLYFAENPKVAGEYKRNLALSGAELPERIAASQIERWSREGGIMNIEGMLARNEMPPGGSERKTYEEALRLLQSGWEPKPGKMYEVRINADPERFLDWDKPLSEQSEAVRGSLGNVPWADEYLKSSNMTGGQLAPQTKEGVAQLREAGIPGIRYLDQGSRGSGEGTYNYVVFDDKLVEIVAKDGKPTRKEPSFSELQAAARASFQPETYRLADMEAVRSADERVAKVIDDEQFANDNLAEVMEEVQALSRALGDEELATRELAPFDELKQTADAYGKAVKAAANCGLRKGAA